MKGIRFKNAGQVEELYRPPHYPNGGGPLGGHLKEILIKSEFTDSDEFLPGKFALEKRGDY